MNLLSTYKILKAKAFNEDVNESWIDWAIEMIEAGYESDNLYMLAGTTRPYNQFALHQLAQNVFQDLKLDYSDRNTVLTNYVYYLLRKSINVPETYYKVLRELRWVCADRDLDANYITFYLLYFAMDDLLIDEVQWYWDGATRQNINEIVRTEFEKWLAGHELNNPSLKQIP